MDWVFFCYKKLSIGLWLKTYRQQNIQEEKEEDYGSRALTPAEMDLFEFL
jgi:hypothetical protein